MLIAATAGRTAAQETPPAVPLFPTWIDPVPEALITLGSDTEDRLRVDQLLGRDSTDGFLLRSASTLTPAPASREPRVHVLLPAATLVWNSALPHAGNDGGMWAGRGVNLGLRIGVQAVAGPLRVILAPEIFYEQNLDFQTIVSQGWSRSRFASPWHSQPESIDLPSRLGFHSVITPTWGQSSAEVSLGPVAAGLAAENLWWGPGIRNAILMSNNAAGIPQLFLRTPRPLRTPIGALEGRWMVGRLDESRYFDSISSDDRRSISGLALVLRPALEPNLSLGVSRVVYGPTHNTLIPLGSAFDVFRSVGRPGQHPREDPATDPAPDQIASLFARWVFPASGFEAYAEWARYEEPASLRDFLETPNHSQGYTLGAQWARPVGAASIVRLQGELTYLEPSSTYRDRRVIPWYTSGAVVQGYTQRGQVIGASIGPGASSQWVAADLLAPSWRVGGFAGRIRWDNAAFYEVVPLPTFLAHDVTLLAGVRAGRSIGSFDVDAQLSLGSRFNYLFQNPSTDWDSSLAVDLRNYTFQLAVRPRLPRS